jgi:hypothetical protein
MDGFPLRVFRILDANLVNQLSTNIEAHFGAGKRNIPVSG